MTLTSCVCRFRVLLRPAAAAAAAASRGALWRCSSAWGAGIARRSLCLAASARLGALGAGGTLSLSILSWLGFGGEEDPESELVLAIKRAVLLKEREEFRKSEQMLHVALRMAQQLGHSQGVTYVYDVMANLAMDAGQYDKAEKLFVSVLQRLLASGVAEDDLKCVHISLKLARIYHLRSDLEKAETGFRWCLAQLERHPEQSEAAGLLRGVVYDWYAQLCLAAGRAADCHNFLQKAYSVCASSMGRSSEKAILLLNDLGVTSWQAGDLAGAEHYLQEALDSAKADTDVAGVVHANLGLIWLQRGLFAQAEKECKRGLFLANRSGHPSSVEQANYCLDQIREMKAGNG